MCSVTKFFILTTSLSSSPLSPLHRACKYSDFSLTCNKLRAFFLELSALCGSVVASDEVASQSFHLSDDKTQQMSEKERRR